MTRNNMSWHHPALYLANAGAAGSGVFTDQQLPKDTLVTLCGGYVMTFDEERLLPEGMSDLAHQIHDNFVLGPKTPQQISLPDKVNHSCSPNVGFNGQIALVTIRDIEEGEQLTFDYAMVLSGEPYKMVCHCQADQCRGQVTADDWQLIHLQKKYHGYFQPYLAEKIKKTSNVKRQTSNVKRQKIIKLLGIS